MLIRVTVISLISINNVSYSEIIFHTGTVNILFAQEKNQWVVKSSELQTVVDFRIWDEE